MGLQRQRGERGDIDDNGDSSSCHLNSRVHTQSQANIHIYIHTYVQACMRIEMFMHLYLRTHVCMYLDKQVLQENV